MSAQTATAATALNCSNHSLGEIATELTDRLEHLRGGSPKHTKTKPLTKLPDKPRRKTGFSICQQLEDAAANKDDMSDSTSVAPGEWRVSPDHMMLMYCTVCTLSASSAM